MLLLLSFLQFFGKMFVMWIKQFFNSEFCSSSVILYVCHRNTLYSNTVLLKTALILQHGDSEHYCTDIEHWASSLSVKCQQMADKKASLSAYHTSSQHLIFLRQVQLFSFIHCIIYWLQYIDSLQNIFVTSSWMTWWMKTNYYDSPYYTTWYGTRVHPSWLSQ